MFEPFRHSAMPRHVGDNRRYGELPKGDHKWNPYARIKHATGKQADPSGSTGPMHIRPKYGWSKETHKIFDKGTIKEDHPHQTSYHSDVSPCGTLCLSQTVSEFEHNIREAPSTSHLQGLMLCHWMFRGLTDTPSPAPISSEYLFACFGSSFTD